ncbi:MAG TPA: flagellar protein FlaG [Nitrospiraceae bacterium]|jgi:flagellar protein FlaG|nr:flagellar protein FlaG [Nitrospiraceae bacterium]
MINNIAGTGELRRVLRDFGAGHSVADRAKTPEAVAGRAMMERDAAPDEQALQRAVARVREVFQGADARLLIEIDRGLNRVVIKIVNGQSGEVIRQIPPEELLDLARRFDGVTGLLLQEHV